MLLLGICNVIVDVIKPYNLLSPLFGLIYLGLLVTVLLCDAVKVKSRAFIIILFTFFSLLNTWNLFHSLVSASENGVAFVSYKIQGVQMTIWKQSLKRAI